MSGFTKFKNFLLNHSLLTFTYLIMTHYLNETEAVRLHKKCSTHNECQFNGRCKELKFIARHGNVVTRSRCNCDHIQCHTYERQSICIEKRQLQMNDQNDKDPFFVLDNYCEVMKLQCTYQKNLTISLIKDACEAVIYSSEEMEYYLSYRKENSGTHRVIR